MKIQDMFKKSIDRNIQGVIKVGQSDDKNIRQELEEYVVTKELQRHFRDFFDSYKKGINGHTDKMGVWVSGFFGSGKSHFLKILSYLLENRQVEEKKALDYFLDDEKIKDPMVIADMRLACSTPTEVVLFNIDSKSKSAGTKGKDSILNVFLRVFNEMQNFSTDPHLADLERQLTEDKVYEDFKNKYEELHNLNWVENRHKFKFHKDKVIETLVNLDVMTEESAKNWARTTTSPYEISIDRFAQLVKDYLDRKEENHHIVFLVDEIGQYIGDNTDLMLNLQTITEDLGTACNGKAWVIVTSQQDIDSIMEVHGGDFSKIQGRFDTRLNLTSANVDEVIKLRVLEKTETARDTLSILYENNETIIKNLLIFNDGIEKKLYKDSKDFYEIYPFIPYQFNLLASVLTSIRQHGASGKHLSEGERSMLALFKESAEKLKDREDGLIVPFNIFYDGLNKFLDHSHSAVVTRALENETINPRKEEDNFNVNVLKTLFLIKYVKEIEANLENITTLMVSNIHDDRIELKERVENALDILVRQTLVQKNGDLYIFLTNEEQEINREIERQYIEGQAITRKISELIYSGILTDDRVRYGKFGNRYTFEFNRYLDNEPYRSIQSTDIGINIISPNSEENRIESNLRMASQRENLIYVDLPNDRSFIDEIRAEMKIEKFLQVSTSSNIPKFEEIKALKRVELREHQSRGKLFLEESLKEADIYLNGDKLDLKGKDIKFNIQDSLERLIDIVYHKLDYIDTPMDQVEIRNLFKDKSRQNVQLDSLETPNIHAINEVLDFIKLRTQSHSKISLKEIKDRFNQAPYGFINMDIEWIISKLFLDGNISMTIHGEAISLLNNEENEIIDYISKRQYAEKLLMEEKELIEEKYIRSLREVSSELFNRNTYSEDTDMMAKQFNEDAKKMIEELNILKENYKIGKYPGQRIIEEGIDLINQTTKYSNPTDVYKELYKNEDDYLDFQEDYRPIKFFFNGNQKDIWISSQKYTSVYKESKSFIFNEEIENTVNEIEVILSMNQPYNRIKDLPELNDQLLNKYNKILDEELEPVKIEINKAEERVLDELEITGLEDKFEQKYRTSFNNLRERAETCDNVAQVNGFRIEAETLKMRYLKEISKELEEQEQKEIESTLINTKTEMKTTPVVIRRKNINIRNINQSNSWIVKNEEDLDQYIKELKDRLKKELEDNTVLNIEF